MIAPAQLCRLVLAMLLATLAFAPDRVAAQQGDVFMNDESRQIVGSCNASCVERFAACEGGISCNYDLELCAHDCACKERPDNCGPAPTHRETDDWTPPDAGGGGSSGSAKGLIRKDCREAGAKGLYRTGCEDECKEAQAKGLKRAGCDELVRIARDCREAAAKGMVRKGCEQFHVDCSSAAAKGIFRPECEELRKKDCLEAAAKGITRPGCNDKQPDSRKAPEVADAVLLQGISDCMAQSRIPYYRPPAVAPARGTVSYDPATGTVLYDPLFLRGMSSYERAFWLSNAFAEHLATQEERQFGVQRAPIQRLLIRDYLTGLVMVCLNRDKVLRAPKDESYFDFRDSYPRYLQKQHFGMPGDPKPCAMAVSQEMFNAGVSSFGAGAYWSLRHDPARPPKKADLFGDPNADQYAVCHL